MSHFLSSVWYNAPLKQYIEWNTTKEDWHTVELKRNEQDPIKIDWAYKSKVETKHFLNDNKMLKLNITNFDESFDKMNKYISQILIKFKVKEVTSD